MLYSHNEIRRRRLWLTTQKYFDKKKIWNNHFLPIEDCQLWINEGVKRSSIHGAKPSLEVYKPKQNT